MDSETEKPTLKSIVEIAVVSEIALQDKLSEMAGECL